MNKLIIIGNGFDLAHGYPTRYSDFILWLVKKELKLACESHQTSWKIENSLFECAYNKQIAINTSIEEYIENNFINILQSSKDKFEYFAGWNSYPSTSPFYLKAKTDFIKFLFQSACENWVDIEHTYYKSLKQILTEFSENSTVVHSSNLSELNEQLVFLCSQLRKYLQSLPMNNFIPDLQEILNRPIDYKGLFKPDKWMKMEDVDIDKLKKECKTYVLNFNYTDTIKQYFQNLDNVVINNIHGSIIDDSNPMIFGYGDELDESFAEMEKQDVKGFLEHVKSLWYLRTINYHDLIRFIESEYYQIQIIGHSCGRSDRTLLNMVFEHPNCNSVDIFYRTKENSLDSFNEISEEVSRQFRDKQKLRKRVLPKNKQNIIPQYIASVDTEANIA